MEYQYKSYLIVGTAGSLGAIARYLMYETIDRDLHLSYAEETLLINIIGVFFLAFLSTLEVEHIEFLVQYRNQMLSGFLGAFTTFSTFVSSISSMEDDTIVGIEFVMLFFSLIVALMVMRIGIYAGDLVNERQLKRRGMIEGSEQKNSEEGNDADKGRSKPYAGSKGEGSC